MLDNSQNKEQKIKDLRAMLNKLNRAPLKNDVRKSPLVPPKAPAMGTILYQRDLPRMSKSMQPHYEEDPDEFVALESALQGEEIADASGQKFFAVTTLASSVNDCLQVNKLFSAKFAIENELLHHRLEASCKEQFLTRLKKML